MPPLHRHVHLVMEKDTYKGLGEQPNIEKAWSLARCMVGEEIFGNDFVAVPHIQSSIHYNQLFVFKKQWDLCKIRKPTYQIISNLDSLLNIELSMWIPQFDFSPWNPSDAGQMHTSFHLKLDSCPSEALKKTIEVTVDKPHVRNSNQPVPGSTMLLPVSRSACDFKNTYILYVITSVVLANFVKVTVSIGDSETVNMCTHVTPVGFKYKKYKILRNGTIYGEIGTTLKFSDREAVWLSPIGDSILRNQLWDPMGRRHDGRRPMRNILTLGTTLNSNSVQNDTGNQAPLNQNNMQNLVVDGRENNIQLMGPAGGGNLRIVVQNPGLQHNHFRNRFNRFPQIPGDDE